MKALASLCLLVVTACTSDAPDLSNLRCTPTQLSASGQGPFNVNCDVDFEGSPGDVSWSAYSTAGGWSGGYDTLSSSDRSRGTYHFAMSKMTAPGIGMLTITFSADHVDGIDGPDGDTITTRIEVVP